MSGHSCRVRNLIFAKSSPLLERIWKHSPSPPHSPGTNTKHSLCRRSDQLDAGLSELYTRSSERTCNCLQSPGKIWKQSIPETQRSLWFLFSPITQIDYCFHQLSFLFFFCKCTQFTAISGNVALCCYSMSLNTINLGGWHIIGIGTLHQSFTTSHFLKERSFALRIKLLRCGYIVSGWMR